MPASWSLRYAFFSVFATYVFVTPAHAETLAPPEVVPAAPATVMTPMAGSGAQGGIDAVWSTRAPEGGAHWEAAAGPQEGMDMLSAVRQTVEGHPSVRNAVSNLQRSEEYIGVARAAYYPQIKGGLSSELSNRDIGRFENKRVQKLSVSASQMLYDFGKVRSNVDQAQAGQAVARARLLATVDQMGREAAQSFIEVQRYEALTRIADEQIRGVAAIARLAKERRALGASTLSDEVQAQSREDAARATSVQMVSQWERWRANLRNLLGQQQTPVVEGDVPLGFSGACQVGEPNWQAIPSVMLALAEQREAEAALDGAAAQTLPTISLEGSASRALNVSNSDSRNDATVGLNFSMPFYQGGGLQAQKRAASHGLQAAQAANANAMRTVTQGLLDAREQALGYELRAPILAQRTQSSRQTRDLYRQQYLDLGTRTLLDLLNAEQEFHQSKVEVVNNMYDLYRLQLDCLFYTGQVRAVFGLDGSTIAGVEIQP